MELIKYLDYSKYKIGVYVATNTIRFTERREPSGSQRRTLPQPLQPEEGKTQETNLSEVHWTLHWKNQLTFREKGFVLETLIFRTILSEHLSLGDYILLSELRFLFKEDSRDFYQQRLIIAADICLNENQLWAERKRLVEDLYREFGTDIRRKYGNLKKLWMPENHLRRVEVPLETYIDQSPSGIPYSSYCKGYGEGSSRGPLKTPLSAELDGEDEEPILDSRILRLLLFLLNRIVTMERKRLLKSSKQ